jgi:hypothetical protein
MVRITSEFFVAAYVRCRNDAGRFTAVLHRGAAEAGAIYIKLARMDRTADLYGPAPQSMIDAGSTIPRLFEQLMAIAPEFEVDERLQREKRFDSDIWIIETEDKTGKADLDVIVEG